MLLQMEAIEKRFPGVLALDRADLTLQAGEVHALVGENGAGKSTMMKVVAGIVRKDAGRVLFKGQEIDVPDPRTAQSMGISIIHQELNLLQHLTVAQNLFLGRENRRWGGFLNEKQLHRQTRALLSRVGAPIDPDVKVASLSVAQQQMVEIAKALSFQSQLLIMDEPTSALTDGEIADLFRLIAELKKQGVGIVYISHRMEELRVIADRVTVMRDGRTIDTMAMADTTVDDIVRMMVGRHIETGVSLRRARAAVSTNSDRAVGGPDTRDGGKGSGSPHRTKGYGVREPLLKVEGLTRQGVFHDVGFQLRKGEIVGMAGLMGAGRTEVARAIFGADPLDAGRVFVAGRPVTVKSPRDAVAHGIAYVSEDRQRFGLALGLSVETNTLLASMGRYAGLFGWVHRRRAIRMAERLKERLDIRTPSVHRVVRYLSGGNQQKVVIAKWLLQDADIFIFDEPTRGIDVGAKSEIYRLLDELAAQGKAILMISSELPEVLRMSDRILVMCEGRLTAQIDAADATEQHILYYAMDRPSVS